MIEEIAFQTNLLALNAAVETARDTTALIQGTITRVRHGTEIAAELDSSFKEIDGGARGVGKLIGDISSATNEQAQGVD